MDKISEVIEILEAIGDTASRTKKESILKQNKDNEELREFLQFMFCDLIVTGISKKKINKKVPLIREYKKIDNLMEYLKENNTGSDRDIQHIQNFITNQPSEHQDYYKAIATKNMKIGITKSTINKVFGKNFIESFDVMLADRYDKHGGKVKTFLVTEKLDGIRCAMVREDGVTTLRTRQGKEILGLVEIEEEAKDLPDNMVYDGELVLKNPNNLNSAELFRETMKVVTGDDLKVGVNYHIFDRLPVEEFRNGKSKLGALDRKGLLQSELEQTGQHFLKEVPVLYQGDDKEEIQFWLEKMEELGKEGVMVNTINGLYECKRSRSLLKVKSFQTADVKVIDVLEGSNSNEGKLGAITIEFEHEGKLHRCNCGSGFSQVERVKFYDEPELLIGNIVEIGYFEVSGNADGGVGLRFPTFKRLREEKTEISMY